MTDTTLRGNFLRNTAQLKFADTASLTWSFDPTTNTLSGTSITSAPADDSITNAKLSNMAQATVKGRASGAGTGDPTDLSASQVKTILSLTSADLSDFNEAAEDAVLGASANSATISISYNDAGNSWSASIITAAVSNSLLANMAQATVKGRASGAGTGVPVDLTAAQVNAILSISNSTYTPTLTSIANVDAVTAFSCIYLRVGNIVFVAGVVNVDATALAATRVGISLPVASNFVAITDGSGTAAATAVQQAGALFSDATNDRMELSYVATSTANTSMFFTFMYQVLP